MCKARWAEVLLVYIDLVQNYPKPLAIIIIANKPKIMLKTCLMTVKNEL